MKRFLAFLIFAALGSGGWYAYSQKWWGLNSAKPEAAVSADATTAPVEVRDIDFAITLSGDVQPTTPLDVKPEVGGRIKKLHVEPAQLVKAGDLLVEIDDRDILTELEAAKADVEGAQLEVAHTKRNYVRAKDLFEQKLISSEAYDELASALALAENALSKSGRKRQLVEDKLSKTKVRAPADGTVLTVPVVEGQVVISAASVNSGTTMMTIANLSRLVVETHVNQVDVAKLALKQEVTLRAESIKGEEMDAEVIRISPVATVKNSVKGFTVQAIIEKPSPRLRPGMTVQMTVPIAHVEDVVSVPVGAVFRGEGNSRVVYVRDGEKTERRAVKVGVTNTDFAEIVQGLKEGEHILLNEPERTPRGKRS